MANLAFRSVRPSEAFVKLDHVEKVYPTAAGEVQALSGVSAEFGLGEFVGIVGKSGAGKSTLVNVVTGVDRATSGRVQVGGVSVTDLEEDQMALWRAQSVGVIYQSFELLPQLSLLDNVLLPMDFAGTYRGQESVARAKALLAQVGLSEHMHKAPTCISGGQQQRVAIARALANDPRLVVADEPTGNLDSATAHEILGLFERLILEGKTVIMVTHDATLVGRFSRLLTIVDGVFCPEAPATDALS